VSEDVALPAPELTYHTAGMAAAQAPGDLIHHPATDLVEGHQLVRIQQQIVVFTTDLLSNTSRMQP
jgi:hypothetical protein